MLKIFTSSIVLFAVTVEPAFSQSEQAKRQAEQTQKQVELVLGIVQQMAKLYIESSLTKATRKEEQDLRARDMAKIKERQIQTFLADKSESINGRMVSAAPDFTNDPIVAKSVQDLLRLTKQLARYKEQFVRGLDDPTAKRVQREIDATHKVLDDRRAALAESAEKLRPFGGLLDVFYTVGGGGAQTPHLSGVRLVGYVELGGRSFARFSGDNETWMIDAARIVAIRVQSDRPGPKKVESEKKETK